MEELILKLLDKEDRALSVYEIQNYLQLESVDEVKELVKALNKLEEDFKIYYTKKGKYLLFKNSHLKVGTLLVNKKGFGFVDIEGDEDVFVSFENMNGAIHKDSVVVEITSKKGMDLDVISTTTLSL